MPGEFMRLYSLSMITAALSVAALCSGPVLAQSRWVGTDAPRSFSFEAMLVRPSSTFASYDISTGGYCISLRLPLNATVGIRAELPFAVHSGTYDVDSPTRVTISQRTLGNPYFGIVHDDPAEAWSIEGGLRLPLVSGTQEYAAMTGMLADVERASAYYYKTITLKGALCMHTPATGVSCVAYLSPEMQIPISKGVHIPMMMIRPYGNHVELWAIAGFAIGFYNRTFCALVGFSDMIWITAPAFDPHYPYSVDRRISRAIDLSVSGKFGAITAGFLIRLPESGFTYLYYGIDAIVGLRLGVAF